MKSKELKTHNIPVDTPVISQIDAKPTWAFVVLIAIGFISFLSDIPKIYGSVTITFALIALIYMPRVLLMEFYYDYFVIYNKADKDNCVLIYYDEVDYWFYSWGANHDYLYIVLSDGKQERLEAFSKTLFESNMNRFMKEKRKKNIS